MERENTQPIQEPTEVKAENNHETKDLVVTMDRLIKSVEDLTQIQQKVAKQNRLGPTILRATAYALGSTLGLAVVISVIFYVLRSVGLFDNLNQALNNLKDLKGLYQ